MTIKEFKIIKGTDLSETQVHDLAEDYLNVMIDTGELIIDLVEVLDNTKGVIRRLQDVNTLVSMIEKYRKLNGLEPYKYREKIK